MQKQFREAPTNFSPFFKKVENITTIKKHPKENQFWTMTPPNIENEITSIKSRNMVHFVPSAHT